MKKKTLPRYLRAHRLRSGLGQEEMAYLLGFKSGSTVSRHERTRRPASLKMAVIYQILFDAPPSELFPKLFVRVEEETVRRAYELQQRLDGRRSKKDQAKLKFLNEVLARAKRRLDDMAI